MQNTRNTQNRQNNQKRVLITGASGFIGQYLARFLENNNYFVVTTSREKIKNTNNYNNHFIKDLVRDDLTDLTTNIDTVIHLAARAHITKEYLDNPQKAFTSANVDATLKLAKAAEISGVKRFIFISSIGVMGNSTKKNEILTEESRVNPHSLYAESKWQAEEALKKQFEKSDTELLILRLPLVYHLDAPANFGKLVSAVKNRQILPFAKIKNQRSLLALVNFELLIENILKTPMLKNNLYIVSDPTPYSTTELIEGLACAVNIPPRLFYLPVPQLFMKFFLVIIGKKSLYQQLWGSLVVDSSKAQQDFNWYPSSDLAENLKE